MCLSWSRLVIILSGVVLLLLLIISMQYEQEAKILVNESGWHVQGHDSSRVYLKDFPPQNNYLRDSAVTADGAVLFRTWTPEKGVVPLRVESQWFQPAKYISIAISGSNRSAMDKAQVQLVCKSTQNIIDVFNGGVNVNVAESLLEIPSGWCDDFVKVRLESESLNTNVGLGSVYEVSEVSYIKSGYLGRLPYLLISIVLLSVVSVFFGALVCCIKPGLDLLPYVLACVGLFSLLVFYIGNYIPVPWQFSKTILILAVLVSIYQFVKVDTIYRVAKELSPYFLIWLFASLVYFSLSAIGVNHVAHWEPNYRFWPASWSSDNELPWMYAEAVRAGHDLKGLFGGGWVPTDRPPLMAAFFYLLADVFSWMQMNNDGYYLRGQAYAAAAVALNAIWVPVVWWLMKRLLGQLDWLQRLMLLVFIGAVPFVLFNTIYGWPKIFGAAFALAAFVQAWQFRFQSLSDQHKSDLFLFYCLCGLSLMAHTSTFFFLVPLLLVSLFWFWRQHMLTVVTGMLMIGGFLLSWRLYQYLILPSHDPLVKFALTGDYGFHSPQSSLWIMIYDRFSSMELGQWLHLKKIAFMQSFIPIDNSIAQVHLNLDPELSWVDQLRSWDFMLLSRGNFVVILTVMLVAALGFSRKWFRPSGLLESAVSSFVILIGMSIVAWLLMVMLFLAPVIVHHWPMAALLGLTIGGIAGLRILNYPLFILGFCSTLLYTLVVWVLSPLNSTLTIDYGAVIGLLLVTVILPVILVLNRSQAVFPSGITLSYPRSGMAFLSSIQVYYANSRMRDLLQSDVWAGLLYGLAAIAFLFSVYTGLRYADQPLVDAHAFRQTQTAMTSLWFLKEGWQLAYQTPVVGYPWSIPFEFPLYQAIVASIAKIGGFSLAGTGRVVSLLFLLLCAWPVLLIARSLTIHRSVVLVFFALFWTAPINVYWGRTFMIETMAMFFSLAMIPFAIDLIRHQYSIKSIILFVLFASLALLQKSTTGGPVLLFLVCYTGITYLRERGFSFRSEHLKPLAFTLVIFFVPLFIGLAWANYTDVIKFQNPFGQQLTSGALPYWNFGTLDQKLDPEVWRLVFWERLLSWNAAGWLGLVLLILPWIIWQGERRYARLSLACIILCVLPVLIFTNLHFVHEYYQVASLVFLIAALAMVIGGWLCSSTGMRMVAPVVTVVIMLMNLNVYNSAYGIVAARSVDQQDPRSVKAYRIGQYLRAHTPPHSSIAVFGQSYSSEVAYQAQRKAMTAPTWFKQYQQFWENPQAYLGEVPLSAIVICPTDTGFPGDADIVQRRYEQPYWQLIQIEDCQLLLRRLGSDNEKEIFHGSK